MKGFKRAAEVVIVGGGIIGASTAYYLAKRGCKDVVVVEKDLLAQASTGLSVGGIRQQFSHPANILLSQESGRIFECFQEEFGKDIRFRQAGYLFLAQHENTWQEFLSAVKIQRDHDVLVEVLSPEEIRKKWPYLHVSDVRGGTFGPKDGYADPYLTAMGFVNASRRLGVIFEERREVTGIKIEGGRIQGVETTKGDLSSPVVVNVAGAWGGKVAGMGGCEIPVRPYRRQVFVTKAFDAIPKPVPMIIDMDVSFYFRGEEPGIMLGMGDPDEPSSFNTHVDWNFLEKVIEAAVHRAPLLERAAILRGWGGLYAVTPDQNPIIGAVPETEGFFCAVGFSGHGFQQGPAVGRILSDLVCDGKTRFDLKPFSFDRFNGREKQGERWVV
jgi:sarcosine oxidase subunit beta